MKLIISFIIPLFCMNLNAFELQQTTFTKVAPKLQQIEDSKELHQSNELAALTKKVDEAKKKGEDLGHQLLRQEEISKDNACLHCPKHLLLTEQVNKVVEKMAKNHKIANDPAAVELPAKINNIKFMYYTLALRQKDGEVKCNRYMDVTPDLKPTKFDGQFKLIAEDILKFSSITDIQYINPDLDEVVYYYRGEGIEKNIIVQAILTKEGGKFRYFKYTPSEKEMNPYDLPNFDTPSVLETTTKEEVKNQAQTTPKKGKDVDLKVPSLGLQQADFKFKAEIEKAGILPNNVKLLETKIEQDVVGFKIEGNATTSLKGNQAEILLKNGETNLAIVHIDTKINGESDAVVTVPFSVRVLDFLPTTTGQIQHHANEVVLGLSLTDKNVDYVRTEVRRNYANNTTNYVIAKDFMLNNDNQVVSVQYGKSDDDKHYVGLKHVRTIKDNITLVLDVKIDSDHQTSLFYQLEAKF